MDSSFLAESVALLERTPLAVNGLLRGLPDSWTSATEGPGTWSPFIVLGHLIHGEKTDWLPRIEMILQYGTARPFESFDREAQFQDSSGKMLDELLDEFIALRRENLSQLASMKLTPDQLELRGVHPAFGPVTLRQLIATWTAHDLAHILQISRVMAKRYKQEVGPWAEYLSVMR